MPGNPNAWAPGMPVAGSKDSVPGPHLDPYLSIDADGDAPQPNLEMDLTIDGSMPWPNLEMDLSIDPPAIAPLTETGSLKPKYVWALDTRENYQAFLDSEFNPLFAATIDDEQMVREVMAAYYLYLGTVAAKENSAAAEIDAEHVHDPEVPANPNAPGYLSSAFGARDEAPEPRSDDPVVDAAGPKWSAEQLAHHGLVSSPTGFPFFPVQRCFKRSCWTLVIEHG